MKPDKIKRHLLTLYTRTPLHVGSGTSVDVVDLPIMRERITGFPVIPSTSLKGVIRDRGRTSTKPDGTRLLTDDDVRTLFGEDRPVDEKASITAYAGCVQITEAKLLAFPVRSLAGCFSWLTCPAALARFQRDTSRKFLIPAVDKDRVVAGTELVVNSQVVLEEYALNLQPNSNGQAATLAGQLDMLTSDPLWTAKITSRLGIVHDENFQHFVTTCTEVVARIKVDAASRTVEGGALFNQENVPCEALFYSVLTVLPPRRNGVAGDFEANTKLGELLPDGKDPKKQPPILQIGGDETTGHGLCESKREELL
jgi:CRISPR-associated protein Cmr4